MAFLNLMPMALRNAMRAFYLRRELQQIDLNELHCEKARDAYQDEIVKGGIRRAAIIRELRSIG